MDLHGLVPSPTPPPPREQNSWHTLMKILPCPKLHLRVAIKARFMIREPIHYKRSCVKRINRTWNAIWKKRDIVLIFRNMSRQSFTSNGLRSTALAANSRAKAGGSGNSWRLYVCVFVGNDSSQNRELLHSMNLQCQGRDSVPIETLGKYPWYRTSLSSHISCSVKV